MGQCIRSTHHCRKQTMKHSRVQRTYHHICLREGTVLPSPTRQFLRSRDRRNLNGDAIVPVLLDYPDLTHNLTRKSQKCDPLERSDMKSLVRGVRTWSAHVMMRDSYLFIALLLLSAGEPQVPQKVACTTSSGAGAPSNSVKSNCSENGLCKT